MFEFLTEEQYRSLDADELEARRAELIEKVDNPADADPAELVEDTKRCFAEYERRNRAAQLRSMSIAQVKGGAGIVSEQRSFAPAKETPVDEDPTNSNEYRCAFMDFIKRGTAIPADLQSRVSAFYNTRANANTLTTDVQAVIPTVIVGRIVEKAESYGMILPLVTKTSYPAGMNIPTASIKPTATWVAEGKTSDRQKLTVKTAVTFTHFKLRCEVSISMETSVMALPVFESKLVESIARAMAQAKEQAILTGDGTSQPKGILTETPATGQAIEVASGAGLSYETLCECEAALPQAYEGGAKWFMSKKSFMAFVGMTDADGQPIARVSYGIGGTPERYLLGREVVLTGDYLPDYAKAPSGDTTFAFLFNMADYVLNSSYDMGITRQQDWDTEDIKTKAVTACDGKVIDVNSLVTLTVKA